MTMIEFPQTNVRPHLPALCNFPCAALVALTTCAAPLCAQTHHVEAPERVTRAVAVYEYTGDLEKPKAARLVPVSLYINGHMEDAGVYLARPVPFALQTGDIYLIQQAGEDKGSFAVDHARDIVPKVGPTADATASWIGYGKFAPQTAAKKAAALHPSAQNPVIVSSSDPDRPHFGKKPDTSAPVSAASTSTTKSTTADKTSTASTGTASTQQANSKNTNSKDTSSASTKSSADDDPYRPTLHKADPAEAEQRRKAAAQSGVTGPEFSLNEDPDRPRIRRGAAPGVASTPELSGLPADMHQVAAVSDPANRSPHVFAREWESPAERADTLAKLEALARPRIASYVAMNQLALGTPAPPAPAAAAPSEQAPPKLQRGVPKEYRTPSSTSKAAVSKSKAAKAKPQPANAPVIIANEQLLPYTLSYGGLPTFVYTAQADLRAGGPVYLTLVAQRMLSGELQVALSSVTDATHLDRTPWMRPVDAVDPDASHRASLLFELRAQTSRQFALYRLTSAQAEQTFVTGTVQ